jgi:chromosome segregation ATPase
MKNLLQNLLVGLSILLCALLAYQWVREAKLHEQNLTLVAEAEAKAGALADVQGQLKREQSETARLDALKAELTDTLKSNRLEAGDLKKELDKARAAVKAVEVYKFGLEQANESIKKQNDSVLKQNEELKKLMTERNELAVKLNKLTEEYNDLVKKWNELQQKLSAPPAAPSALRTYHPVFA